MTTHSFFADNLKGLFLFCVRMTYKTGPELSIEYKGVLFRKPNIEREGMIPQSQNNKTVFLFSTPRKFHGVIFAKIKRMILVFISVLQRKTCGVCRIYANKTYANKIRSKPCYFTTMTAKIYQVGLKKQLYILSLRTVNLLKRQIKQY